MFKLSRSIEWHIRKVQLEISAPKEFISLILAKTLWKTFRLTFRSFLLLSQRSQMIQMIQKEVSTDFKQFGIRVVIG